MRQFLKLLGRTRKGNLTAQPQRLRYRPRRPATALSTVSAVQGEKSPAHSPDSGMRSLHLYLPFGMDHRARAFRSTSSSDPLWTNGYLPFCNTNSPSISPINSRRSPANLPAISSKLGGFLPPTPTSPQTSPLRLEQTSPLPLLASSYSPFALPFFLFLDLLSAFQKIWDAPQSRARFPRGAFCAILRLIFFIH